jgi:hypothetical protein
LGSVGGDVWESNALSWRLLLCARRLNGGGTVFTARRGYQSTVHAIMVYPWLRVRSRGGLGGRT